MREEDQPRPAPDKSWIQMEATGGSGYWPQATVTGSERDGALTKREKRNLWIGIGSIVLFLAVCCGAGVAAGVFFA